MRLVDLHKNKRVTYWPLFMDTAYKLTIFLAKREPDHVIYYKTYFQ